METSTDHQTVDRIPQTLLWWVISVCVGLIGGLGILLYNVNTQSVDRRQLAAELDIKVLTTTQTKLIAVVDTLAERVKSNETVLVQVAGEQQRRGPAIGELPTLRTDVAKIGERIIIIEQQLKQVIESQKDAKDSLKRSSTSP